jgi:transcriptional regulator GlxA family with amidase domain
MTHISLIIPQGEFSITNIDLTRQLFTWVNDQLPDPALTLELVSSTREVNPNGGMFTVRASRLLSEISHTDVIIIPATFGQPQQIMQLNKELVPWIIGHYHNGADLVSMCVGAFFLGSMGILDGKKCSTHWSSAEEFRALFPNVILEDERIVSVSDRIYTSGGALAFANLLIYLVERYVGRAMAVAAAKTFMIDIDRSSQSPFVMFAGQKSHRDKEVLRAQEYIESHFNERLTIEMLCEEVGVGKRTFERRLKSRTANTVYEYIQRVKVEAAKKDLELDLKSISEIMYAVGYNDTKAFRNIFKRTTGLTPLAYRNKYGKMAIA